MIRAVLASVADVAIVPLQDVLGLGSAARMNLPGTVSGNWKWRYRPGALSGELSARLRSLTALYDRWEESSKGTVVSVLQRTTPDYFGLPGKVLKIATDHLQLAVRAVDAVLEKVAEQSHQR